MCLVFVSCVQIESITRVCLCIIIISPRPRASKGIKLEKLKTRGEASGRSMACMFAAFPPRVSTMFSASDTTRSDPINMGWSDKYRFNPINIGLYIGKRLTLARPFRVANTPARKSSHSANPECLVMSTPVLIFTTPYEIQGAFKH